jgi:hypothetical protein
MENVMNAPSVSVTDEEYQQTLRKVIESRDATRAQKDWAWETLTGRDWPIGSEAPASNASTNASQAPSEVAKQRLWNQWLAEWIDSKGPEWVEQNRARLEREWEHVRRNL